MNNLTGLWTIGTDASTFEMQETFNTKEQAISFGKDFYDGDDFYVGYVGQLVECPIQCDTLGEYVIETVHEAQVANDGDDAEEYLYDVADEHLNELDEMLKKVFKKWAKKHNYVPQYHRVVNIEHIESEGLYV